MQALYFGDAVGNERLYLHGEGVVPPVREAVRQVEPNRLPDRLVEEVITIACKAGDIRGLITQLELRLRLLQDGIQPWHLWMEAGAGSTPIGAPLLGGRLELLGGGTADRLRGFQGLRLRLVRRDWLAEIPDSVPLQNAHGVDVVDGLTVFNHADSGSGHVNFCDVKGNQILGSQPQPVRLILEVGGPAIRRLGKIVVSGGIDLWNEAGSFDHVLEGESASAGAGCSATSAVPSSSASNGIYQTFQWSVVTECAVLRWTISNERLAWLAGRGLHPVARFQTAPPANTRWRWRLLAADGSTQLDQSALVLLDSASQLQVLPAFFPPTPGSTAPYQACVLEAWLECTTAGVKQIGLDFVQLFPLENFAIFQPVGGIDENHNLVMDWTSGECFSEAEADGAKLVTHLVSGSAIALYPQRNHRIYLLYETDTGFAISDIVRLRVEAGARWLNL
ncbi:MAG TPA: hypothetical protein VN364_10380 [Bellilinea sp.]|nr:hypothetical protein [Bellilinea sp.]